MNWQKLTPYQRNVLVHRKVMQQPLATITRGTTPRYSENMHDAWRVVDWMVNLPSIKFMKWWDHSALWSYSEAAAAQAICIAALRACGMQISL
jgi:hypothetical protein